MSVFRAPYERWTEDEWKRLLSEFERSGESAASFAARHGLALSTFQRWKQRLQTKPAALLSPSNSLVPLTLAMESLCELCLTDGRTLRFPASLPAQTLRCWLLVLEDR